MYRVGAVYHHAGGWPRRAAPGRSGCLLPTDEARQRGSFVERSPGVKAWRPNFHVGQRLNHDEASQAAALSLNCLAADGAFSPAKVGVSSTIMSLPPSSIVVFEERFCPARAATTAPASPSGQRCGCVVSSMTCATYLK
jgi:hypothetical protein